MWTKSLSVMLVVLAIPGCAVHAFTSGRVAVRDDHATFEVRFSDRDRKRIEEYYRAAKSKKAPSGLARRDTLPPGLQGRLLPRELESRLVVLPETFVRIVVGRDIVLMNRDTRVVLDILHGVAD